MTAKSAAAQARSRHDHAAAIRSALGTAVSAPCGSPGLRVSLRERSAEAAPAPSVLTEQTERSRRAEAPTRSISRAVPDTPARRMLPRPLQLTAAEEQELAGGPFVDSAAQQAEAAAAAKAAADAPPVTAAAPDPALN